MLVKHAESVTIEGKRMRFGNSPKRIMAEILSGNVAMTNSGPVPEFVANGVIISFKDSANFFLDCHRSTYLFK